MFISKKDYAEILGTLELLKNATIKHSKTIKFLTSHERNELSVTIDDKRLLVFSYISGDSLVEIRTEVYVQRIEDCEILENEVAHAIFKVNGTYYKINKAKALYMDIPRPADAVTVHIENPVPSAKPASDILSKREINHFADYKI